MDIQELYDKIYTYLKARCLDISLLYYCIIIICSSLGMHYSLLTGHIKGFLLHDIDIKAGCGVISVKQA